MTTTAFTEHPPVPRVLQEALRDYPALIADLRESLQTVGRHPGMKERLGDLHQGSAAQRQWHRDLPARAPNGRVTPDTTRHLLDERHALQAEPGVQRLHHEVGGYRAVRPTVKALGVAGTVFGQEAERNARHLEGRAALDQHLATGKHPADAALDACSDAVHARCPRALAQAAARSAEAPGAPAQSAPERTVA